MYQAILVVLIRWTETLETPHRCELDNYIVVDILGTIGRQHPVANNIKPIQNCQRRVLIEQMIILSSPSVHREKERQ